jgi:hypothetical protein
VHWLPPRGFADLQLGRQYRHLCRAPYFRPSHRQLQIVEQAVTNAAMLDFGRSSSPFTGKVTGWNRRCTAVQSPSH